MYTVRYNVYIYICVYTEEILPTTLSESNSGVSHYTITAYKDQKVW